MLVRLGHCDSTLASETNQLTRVSDCLVVVQ